MIRLALGFGLAAIVMLYSFNMAEWRVAETALPRYCSDHEGVLKRVHEILTEKNPVGEHEKRPYMVAAKLLYMIPQESGETTEAYLLRLGAEIREKCR